MDYNDFGELACIKETHSFYGNRIMGNKATPLYWTITCIIRPMSQPKGKGINKSVVAYERIKFWLENVFDDVFIAERANELGVNLSYYVENPVLLTPFPPTDNHILQLIHSKLSVLARNDLEIGLMTLENTETNSLCIFNTEINAHNLPSVEDYMDDMYHELPWWKRDSFDYADFTKSEVADDKELKEYMEVECPLTVFEHELMKIYDTRTDKKKVTAEIIKMPKKWKPKLV